MTTATTTSPLTGTWTLDPAHTRLGFSARHAMVATVRGSFREVSGVLQIDGDDPTKSTAQVTLQSASLDSGSADRDGHLKSADFIDVEKWPTIDFVSTSARVKGEDEYVLVGDLTIKGVTRPIELSLTYLGGSTDPFGNARAGFEGEAQFSRKDFGLVWNMALETGGVLVGDKVKLSIDVSAIKQA